MGRTLPSITQAFLQEQESFNRFRRALRRSDQLALDDLFVSAQKHLAAAAYAAHALPMEIFLLAMLLEEHKLNLQLYRRLEILSPAPEWLAAPEGSSTSPADLEAPSDSEPPAEAFGEASGEVRAMETFSLPAGLKPRRAHPPQPDAEETGAER